MNKVLFCVMGCLALTGCGGMSPAQIEGPVNVKGSVLNSAGKPVGDVAMNLQPLETGYAKTVEVKSDGTFAVETHAGPYAYYFTPKSGAKSTPKDVANYLQANLKRTVVVNNGHELKIVVD